MKSAIQMAGFGLIVSAVAASAHDPAPDTTSPDIIRAIVPAIQKCWAVPAGVAEQKPHVTLKVRFKADATLDGNPQVTTEAKGAGGEAFTASTLRAIAKCQPYDVLLKHPYERWREIIINFDL